jgi:thymidylate synthase
MLNLHIILCSDSNYGISKINQIPWNIQEEKSFFSQMTKRSNNIVIMGKNSFLEIGKSLPNRINLIVSKTLDVSKYENIQVFSSVEKTIEKLQSLQNINKIFLCGGISLIESFMKNKNVNIESMFISFINKNYNCDSFINQNWFSLFQFVYKYPISEMIYFHLYSKHEIGTNENKYLKSLNKVLKNGKLKENRTQINTISLFGQIHYQMDLRISFPILTTKFVSFKTVAEELFFFISGNTNTKVLEQKGVNIWKDNTSNEFLSKNNLQWKEGDMGPGYGFQWRHCNAEYSGCDQNYENKGVDQLKNLIIEIEKNKNSRRLIMCSWNPSQNKYMALPPCHCLFQCNIEDGFIDGLLYQRSADMFLGVPYNIVSYSLLIHIIGNICNLTPRFFSHSFGDTHIYENHLIQVKNQLNKIVLSNPILKINKKFNSIDDPEILCFQNYELLNYSNFENLYAKMAI